MNGVPQEGLSSPHGRDDDDVNEICLRFAHAWQKGPRPKLNDYLEQYTRQPRTQERRRRLFYELLKVELDYRQQAGETPGKEEYERLFPEDCVEIRHAFFGDTILSPGGVAPSTANLDQPRELQPGDKIAHFEIKQEIDRGGIAIVYRARDTQSLRDVALKILRAERVKSEKDRERFRKEAETAKHLHHPGIAKLFEFGTAEVCGVDYFYIAYELIEGRSLKQWLESRCPSHAWAAELIARVAEAAASSHSQGLYHRDLKPANIMLDAQDRPYLIDFGLVLDRKERWDHVGEFAGTPLYMAPEQLDGTKTQNIDGRTDVWALGVILYEMLTTERPFDGVGQEQIELDIKTRDPTPPRQRNPKIPSALETICLKCLAKEMADRYGTANDLARALRSWNPPLPRAVRWVLTTTILALAVALITWIAIKQRRDSDPPGQVHLAVSQVGDGEKVASGAMMQTGQTFRIAVKADTPAFLALVQFTSEGQLQDVPISKEPAETEKHLQIEARREYILPPSAPEGYLLTAPSGGEIFIPVTGLTVTELDTVVKNLKDEVARRLTSPIGIPKKVRQEWATRGHVAMVKIDDEALVKVEVVRQVCLELLGEDRLLVIWNMPPRAQGDGPMPGIKNAKDGLLP